MSGFNKKSYPHMDFFKAEVEEEDTQDDLGISPTKRNFDPTNFKCFEFHTNFDIEKIVALAIEYTPGVEFIKVMSPYRAFIGIGKFFEDDEVKMEIKKRVSDAIRQEDIMGIIKDMEKNTED